MLRLTALGARKLWTRSEWAFLAGEDLWYVIYKRQYYRFIVVFTRNWYIQEGLPDRTSKEALGWLDNAAALVYKQSDDWKSA